LFQQEVLWTIHNGGSENLPLEFVPQSILDAISLYATANGGIENAEDFTAYKGVGSPMHPSYPAMHSAASNYSFLLQISSKATPQMVCEAIKVDFAVSKARTAAGVHFVTDNIDGLNIGQEQASLLFPTYFKEMGGDYDYIKAKVDAKRFDWRNVDMTKLYDVDCRFATDCDLAGAGVSSFTCGLQGFAVGSVQSSTVVGSDGVVQDFNPGFDIPPAFNFNFDAPPCDE